MISLISISSISLCAIHSWDIGEESDLTTVGVLCIGKIMCESAKGITICGPTAEPGILYH